MCTARSPWRVPFGKRGRVADAAGRPIVATQMGNQGYSSQGIRRCAELIQSGAIGKVTEVHAWTNRPVWPQGMQTLPPRRAGSGNAPIGTTGLDPRRRAV